MLKRLRDLLATSGSAVEAPLPASPTRLTASVRLACRTRSVRLQLGEHVLGLYRERRLSAGGVPTGNWVLFDTARFGREVSGFVRLREGESLIVGRTDLAITRRLGLGSSIKARHLKISVAGGDVILTPLDAAANTEYCALDGSDGLQDPGSLQLRNLARVREIIGGPIGLLPNDLALATLEQVNALLEWEQHRRKDSAGQPGGLLVLPPDRTPIIVGDLHASVDNLLRILSEDGYLAALESGSAYLLFLGDAIHSEQDGELEEMDSSIMILDLIFKLMVRFPDNVFYVRGNHESFDTDVSKGGVPQGLLLKKRVQEVRGERYARELGRFFDLLPYVAMSGDFAACHGGPAQTGIRRGDIVEIRGHQDLARGLTRIRPRRPGGYTGFTRRDVEAFRRDLELPNDAAVIVAHTPLTSDEAFWTNANGIPNHHIVYSAHRNSIGVFVRLGGDLTALELTTEPLTELTNSLPGAPERARPAPCMVGAA